MSARKSLWHDTLIVVDEAHHFCPQKGKGKQEEASSAPAVIDLMTRGRKRGFCGILATQRLSKLHKDAAAEANFKLIGRAALDVDVDRAAEELGFKAADRGKLRTLEAGAFFLHGPGLPGVSSVRIGSVETTHPRPGQRAAPVPPAREKVRKVLAQLADLPKEAAEEARTAADLQRRVRDLERQLAARPTPPPQPAPEKIEVQVVADETVAQLRKLVQEVQSAAAGLAETGGLLSRDLQKVGHAPRATSSPIARAARVVVPISPMATRRQIREFLDAPAVRALEDKPTPPAGMLKGPEQRILDAIAWLESVGQNPAEQAAVAFVAGYTVGGGAFNNPRGALRAAGLITYHPGDRLALTDAGRELAAVPDEALTQEELQARVLRRLPGPERRILTELLRAYPEALENDELARRAKYEPGGGAFNNPRGRLRSLGLVTYPDRGLVAASPVLFLEGR